MSKRHQVNRRRAYARRQHELRERIGRHNGDAVEFDEIALELNELPLTFLERRLVGRPARIPVLAARSSG